jgi:heterotetrameric sarcosine oxidase gamma subunit
MLERRSALATAKPYQSKVLTIAEEAGFTLIQAAGLSTDFDERIAKAAGAIPYVVGRVVNSGGRAVMRTGPAQLWFVGPEKDDLDAVLRPFAAVTSLTNSRTRIRLEGNPARPVLAKGIALDFDPEVFAPGHFAQTGVHHMPLLIHCLEENAFHLYVMRTFALSLWEWLIDAALEFAD